MKRTAFLAACIMVASVGCLAGTNDLAIAREALRDGLYSVARTHATAVGGGDARLIVLESFAREGMWKSILSQLDADGYPKGDGFAYYRALALFKDGSLEQASNVLAKVNVDGGEYEHPVARLGAKIALGLGDGKRALELLEKHGGNDVETKMMIAECAADGKRSAAIWREVVADESSAESVRAMAAVNLKDVPLMRKRLESTVSSPVRTMLSIHLGAALIKSTKTFDEGEGMLVSAVKDRPDCEGAKESWYSLGDAYLSRGNWARSAATYEEAIQVWPDSVNDVKLHSGLAAAYAKLQRYREAKEEFAKAEELSPDDESKAMELLRCADALSGMDRQDEATEAYRQVRDKYPQTHAASLVEKVIGRRERENAARTAYAEFKFDEADRIFADIARDDQSSAGRIKLYRALCAYGAGRDDDAERMMTEIVSDGKWSDERAHAVRWLAKYNFNRSRWRESERLFSEYAELVPDASDVPEALVWAARSALADRDFNGTIAIASKMASRFADSPFLADAMLAQGEALIELGRFDEAVLVLETSLQIKNADGATLLRAKMLRADAFFAVGADNQARYATALDAYNSIRTGEDLPPDDELMLSYKIAKTLEKLRRMDEAIDMYYTKVVLAYRAGRISGVRYDDASKAAFVGSAMRLAEEFESRGRNMQAMHVMELVRVSDVPASAEAARIIERLKKKGR